MDNQPDHSFDSETSLKPFAALATPSQAMASLDDKPHIDDERERYPSSIEAAVQFFVAANFCVAARTLSHYCQTSQMNCKKFTSQGVRRWYIQADSLKRHLNRLQIDGNALASVSKPVHATGHTTHEPSNNAIDSKSSAVASELSNAQAIANTDDKYVALLEKQLDEKDSQIKALLSQSGDLAFIAKGLGGLLSTPNAGDTET